MNEEEYYTRIEKINNRFKTDRVSADEEYQLVCQKNYLSTKYIENLEQQVKKQQEVIDKAIEFYENNEQECVIGRTGEGKLRKDYYLPAHLSKTLIDILKEVSE